MSKKQQAPKQSFARTMRPVTEEEQLTWDVDLYKDRLYSSVSRRFGGGPLLYQVNMDRPDRLIEDAVFTMHPQDMIHMPTNTYMFSLHKIYLEESDITEYSVAQRLFGSLKLWQSFVANAKIVPYIEELREELKLKLKSETLSAMRQTMLTEGSKGTSAARYLAEMNKAESLQEETGTNSERYASRGRSAAGLQQSEEQLEDGFEEDLERLQLIVNNG